MCAQKLSFDYAHTLHTVRIVHNAHSVHRLRVQKGKSCDCINFVRATDIACGSVIFLIEAYDWIIKYVTDWYLKNNKQYLLYIGNDTYKLPFKDKKIILEKCIWGIDIDIHE